MNESSLPLSSVAGVDDIERLLTFEYDSTMYALPIAEVHEVAEAERICCVPTIPADEVGVMNWHGEALPVVAAKLLLGAVAAVDAPAVEGLAGEVAGGLESTGAALKGEGEPASLSDETSRKSSSADSAGPKRAVRASHVLVLSARDDEPARLGLPIDRVLGLVDGPRKRRGGNLIIVERRPLDGRVVNVLDPCALVARATEVIGQQTA